MLKSEIALVLNNMAVNFANMLNSFVDNLYKSETTDDCLETSAVSEHCDSIANKVIELNHVNNELISIESRLMEHYNTNKLKNCQLITEKEANILMSLNEKLLFLHEEVRQIKSALFSFKHEKALLIPKEAQKDFLKTVEVLSDLNNNLEKVLGDKRESSDESLKNFIEVFEKYQMEMKQAVCVLSKTYSELKNENMTMKNLTKRDYELRLR
ncbi:hypothetical protein LSTR_LSTR005852 [Laodelphax striatellus]|uniref:Uncharacterized protein n=1 Tax=Laodelphax striatellus TaxID=195883 RepID=A0A482WRY7_LAOST|nr:hypothetical protein LSTR_LSTR005852 [Laodelphax striatellus]